MLKICKIQQNQRKVIRIFLSKIARKRRKSQPGLSDALPKKLHVFGLVAPWRMTKNRGQEQRGS